MSEPISIAVAGYVMALNLAMRTGSGVSAEAQAVRRSACALVDSLEKSITLFGPKSIVISEIHDLAADCIDPAWDGEEATAIYPIVVERAINFIRALPNDVRLPQVAADPDGALSLDWISSRTRVFSVSVGSTNRLAYAWIDGTDRGHAVARFDGTAIPGLIMDGIRQVEDGGDVAFRTA
ncbi:MAG TPA: hypothetical protein VNM92_14340 [Thermoanaerobaculia bacterium]|nr:hypothetical protein [Thermoanaerobaculia bacterium]